MEDDDDNAIFEEFFSRRTLSRLCTGRNLIRIFLFAGLIVATRYLGVIVAIVTGFILIVRNLRYGARDTGRSAYSVFNEGIRPLMGDLRAATIERELRGAQASDSVDEDLDEEEDLVQDGIRSNESIYRSRLANRRCICGSGKKTKKCCGGMGGRNE